MPPPRSFQAFSSYRWLPLAAFVFFALSFLLHPASPLRNGQLLDTDDYMRLNEVINWLQSAHPFGAGWFDLSHPRLNPGEHAVVHWARLVDVPIALFMLPLLHFMNMQSAALVASFIVPPLLFIALLLLMPAVARPLIGRPYADLTAALLLFMPAVTMNFLPGRVDHHGYQIIIAAFGLLCLQRILLCPRGWKAAIAAAFAFACGLWIGTEALPWLMIFCATLALIAAFRGGLVLRNAAIFGIALPLAVAVILPVAMPPAEYSSRALSWFSSGDLIFAALAGCVLIGGWIGGRKTANAWLRIALIAALGFFAAMVFVWQAPDILTGAYANYDAFFNETLVGNIGEAQPLAAAMRVSIYNPASFAHAALIFLHSAFLPSLAALIAIWNFVRTKGRRRILWLTHGFFLLPALLLTIFWQVRVGWFAQVFSIVPLTWLMLRCWRNIGARLAGRPRFWAEIAAFLLIAPLPVVLLPMIAKEAPLYPDVLLFPAARPAPVCPLQTVSTFLNEHYPNRPFVILSGTNEGPELLFRTRHKVLAAPYNVIGNRDSFRFFHANDDPSAIGILRQRHVDLVLVCRNFSLFYAGLDSRQSRIKAHLYMDSRGILRMSSSQDKPTVIERLVNGDTPEWLNPVELPFESDYLLFEVNWVRG